MRVPVGEMTRWTRGMEFEGRGERRSLSPPFYITLESPVGCGRRTGQLLLTDQSLPIRVGRAPVCGLPRAPAGTYGSLTRPPLPRALDLHPRRSRHAASQDFFAHLCSL